MERIRAIAERLNKVDEFMTDFDTACKMGMYGAGFDWLYAKWTSL